MIKHWLLQFGDPWNLGVIFLFRPEHIIMQIKSCHWSSEILSNTCNQNGTEKWNLWYYGDTMINDISFQVFLEVHFSHFVEYINIMRTRAHTHTSLWDQDIHECMQSHTHASFRSLRCSSTLVYDGCTHFWQVIFGLVDLRMVQYVASCSIRCDTFHLYF